MGMDAPNDRPSDDARADCTTTASFDDHGIEDGLVLVTETHRRLREASVGGFEPTDAFFDRLESAFTWAYLGAVDEAGVPAGVSLAVADARRAIEDEFGDREDADVRTDVVPAFYRAVAGYHCAYRD
jgi:hypothetical protein